MRPNGHCSTRSIRQDTSQSVHTPLDQPAPDPHGPCLLSAPSKRSAVSAPQRPLSAARHPNPNADCRCLADSTQRPLSLTPRTACDEGGCGRSHTHTRVAFGCRAVTGAGGVALYIAIQTQRCHSVMSANPGPVTVHRVCTVSRHLLRVRALFTRSSSSLIAGSLTRSSGHWQAVLADTCAYCPQAGHLRARPRISGGGVLFNHTPPASHGWRVRMVRVSADASTLT